jgi:hypothetical protein
MQKFNSYIVRTKGDNSPAFCPKCNQDKPASAYYVHSTRADGAIRYRPYCKQCRVVGGRKNWARPVHSTILAAGVQKCKFCDIDKPLSEFYANGCFSDGTKKYRARCKECVLASAKVGQERAYSAKAEKRSKTPKNFISGMLNHAARRKQHLGFDLDLMYLLELFHSQNGRCAISGVNMTHIAGMGRVNTNISLDRVDSSKGYLRGNVQLVCGIVNIMKQDMPQPEFISWCQTILANANEKT